MGSGSRPGSFRTRSTFATRSIPLLAPERDAAATENPTLIAKTSADDFAAQARLAPLGGPGRRVDGVLGERDEVAGFSVFDVRGHTHGHAAYWRESKPSTRPRRRGQQRARQDRSSRPPRAAVFLTTDRAENCRSVRRLLPHELRNAARSGGRDADHAITEAPPRFRGSDPNRGHCRRGADALRSGRLTTAGRLTSGPPGPHLQSLIA